MKQRIAPDAFSAQILKNLSRSDEQPIFIIPIKHETAQDAAETASTLKTIYKATGAFNIAYEIRKDSQISNFLDNLADKNEQDIRSLAKRFSSPNYIVPFLLEVKNYKKNDIVKQVYPVDMGPENQGFKRWVELWKEYQLLKSGTEKVSFEEFVSHSVKTLQIINETMALRDPIIAENINQLIKITKLPIVVVIGRAHLPYLEQNLQVDSIVSLINKTGLIDIEIKARSREAALKGAQTNEDKLAIIKSYLHGSFVKSGDEKLDAILSNKIVNINSREEAEKLLCELQR